MKIIALCGFKQSGKSTTFNLIEKKANKKGKVLREVSFANKLKDVCGQVFNVPRSHFDDQDKKEVLFPAPKKMTRKELMQVLEAYHMDKKVSGDKLKDFIRDFKDIDLIHPRQIAQFVGTKVLRALKDDIHCETLHDVMKEQASLVDVFVITDCRFLNEIEYFKDEEAFSAFFIHRLKAYDLFIRELDRGDSHPSEIETLQLIPKCQILDNNGDLTTYSQIVDMKVKV